MLIVQTSDFFRIYLKKVRSSGILSGVLSGVACEAKKEAKKAKTEA